MFQHIVIYKALCFDVAQGRRMGDPMRLELTRVTVTPPEVPRDSNSNYVLVLYKIDITTATLCK